MTFEHNIMNQKLEKVRMQKHPLYCTRQNETRCYYKVLNTMLLQGAKHHQINRQDLSLASSALNNLDSKK